MDAFMQQFERALEVTSPRKRAFLLSWMQVCRASLALFLAPVDLNFLPAYKKAQHREARVGPLSAPQEQKELEDGVGMPCRTAL